MSKTVSTKKINAGILAIALVVGTFAAISPSFMIGVHAQLYGKKRNDDKESYGKENSHSKSENSSNGIVKIIECNNFNSNANGFNEVGTLPTALSGLATDEAQVSDEDKIAPSGSDAGRPTGSDTDFKVVCIYNNILPEPIKNPILTVKKEMFISSAPHKNPDMNDPNRLIIDCIDRSGTI